MSSWRMARVVVPLTPTSSPQPWWLVSGDAGWVLLGSVELGDAQGRRTGLGCVWVLGSVSPRGELVSPRCAGSQGASSDPELPSPKFLLLSGQDGWGCGHCGPSVGRRAWAKGAIPMGTFSWQMASCTLEQSAASRETTQPFPGARAPGPPRLRAPSTGYKVEFCLGSLGGLLALGRGHGRRGS